HAATRSDGDGFDDKEISEWREFLQPFAPHERILHNLELLRDPRARVVVTGQQCGLLGGPLYTLYKAIGAVRWAERLAKELGRPVVPIFWAASDDHDFEEVSWHK